MPITSSLQLAQLSQWNDDPPSTLLYSTNINPVCFIVVPLLNNSSPAPAPFSLRQSLKTCTLDTLAAGAAAREKHKVPLSHFRHSLTCFLRTASPTTTKATVAGVVALRRRRRLFGRLGTRVRWCQSPDTRQATTIWTRSGGGRLVAGPQSAWVTRTRTHGPFL